MPLVVRMRKKENVIRYHVDLSLDVRSYSLEGVPHKLPLVDYPQDEFPAFLP